MRRSKENTHTNVSWPKTFIFESRQNKVSVQIQYVRSINKTVSVWEKNRRKKSMHIRSRVLDKSVVFKFTEINTDFVLFTGNVCCVCLYDTQIELIIDSGIMERKWESEKRREKNWNRNPWLCMFCMRKQTNEWTNEQKSFHPLI